MVEHTGSIGHGDPTNQADIAEGGEGQRAPAPPADAPAAECFASPIVREVMDYFITRGWPPVQAAGIVANLQAESGLCSEAVGDGGLTYGLAQWDMERQAAFATFAGHSIRRSTFAEQLSFVAHELTRGGEIWAGRRLRAAISASQAGAIVAQYYGRPNFLHGEADRRGQLAEQIVRTYRRCR